MPTRFFDLKKPGCDVVGGSFTGSPNHSLEVGQRAGKKTERTPSRYPEFWKEVERWSKNQEVKKFREGWSGVCRCVGPSRRNPVDPTS